MTATATATKGLLLRLEASPGKEDELERLLVESRSLVEQEPDTTAWFAVRFGASEYGIFDVFAHDEARSAHLSGAVARALTDRGDELFAAAPRIAHVDVLADKLPASPGAADEVRKGLLLTFAARAGHEDDVADLLRGARGFVEREPGTLAWFAMRLQDRRYGIFDVFPDNRARFAHLTGRVPRELAKRGLSLLGSLPDMDRNDVLAAKLGG
jgi:quinol monooxygenase YgiN